jgi:DNA-binding transcriptional MerR regulator
VSAQYLRVLEWKGIIPPARRDFNGRLYSDFDIALLKRMGVGSHPRRLKRPDEALGER